MGVMLPSFFESERPCDTPDSSIVDFSFRLAKRLHRFASRHPDRACDVSRSKDRIGCNLPRAPDQVTSSRIGSQPLPSRSCSQRRSRSLSNGLSCLGSSQGCFDSDGRRSCSPWNLPIFATPRNPRRCGFFKRYRFLRFHFNPSRCLAASLRLYGLSTLNVESNIGCGVDQIISLYTSTVLPVPGMFVIRLHRL